MLNSKILYTSLISFSISLIALQSSSAREAEFEWVIEQNIVNTGSATVYASHDAVKLKDRRTKISILTKAPLWYVYVINDEERTFWKGRMEQFTAGKLFNPFSDNYSQPSTEQTDIRSNNQAATFIKPLKNVIGSGSIQGLRYTQYNWEDSGQNHAVIWAADDINLAPQCARLLCCVSNTPESPKLQLYCRFTARPPNYSKEHDRLKHSTSDIVSFGAVDSEFRDLRGGPIVRLTTQSWKKLLLNNQDFAIPVGYKRLGRITSVTFSRKAKSELTTFIDQAGFLSPSSVPNRKTNGSLSRTESSK